MPTATAMPTPTPMPTPMFTATPTPTFTGEGTKDTQTRGELMMQAQGPRHPRELPYAISASLPRHLRNQQHLRDQRELPAPSRRTRSGSRCNHARHSSG
jgi:hypothetical protein